MQKTHFAQAPSLLRLSIQFLFSFHPTIHNTIKSKFILNVGGNTSSKCYKYWRGDIKVVKYNKLSIIN